MIKLTVNLRKPNQSQRCPNPVAFRTNDRERSNRHLLLWVRRRLRALALVPEPGFALALGGFRDVGQLMT